MLIKIKKSTVIDGSVWPAGSVLEQPVKMAEALMTIGMAEAVEQAPLSEDEPVSDPKSRFPTQKGA